MVADKCRWCAPSLCRARSSACSHALDDRCRAHAGTDAQRHQRGREVAPLQFVDDNAEDHCAGGAERMAHGNGAAIDVDFGGIEVEGLQIAAYHGCERLVDLHESDVVQGHVVLGMTLL